MYYLFKIQKDGVWNKLWTLYQALSRCIEMYMLSNLQVIKQSYHHKCYSNEIMALISLNLLSEYCKIPKWYSLKKTSWQEPWYIEFKPHNLSVKMILNAGNSNSTGFKNKRNAALA